MIIIGSVFYKFQQNDQFTLYNSHYLSNIQFNFYTNKTITWKFKLIFIKHKSYSWLKAYELNVEHKSISWVLQHSVISKNISTIGRSLAVCVCTRTPKLDLVYLASYFKIENATTDQYYYWVVREKVAKWRSSLPPCFQS